MNSSQVTDALNTMTRSQLRAVATRLNVPRGRNRQDTVENLTNSIVNGNGRFTLQFTIRENGISDDSYARTIFAKKLRTHKPDKVLYTVK